MRTEEGEKQKKETNKTKQTKKEGTKEENHHEKKIIKLRKYKYLKKKKGGCQKVVWNVNLEENTI